MAFFLSLCVDWWHWDNARWAADVTWTDKQDQNYQVENTALPHIEVKFCVIIVLIKY